MLREPEHRCVINTFLTTNTNHNTVRVALRKINSNSTRHSTVYLFTFSRKDKKRGMMMMMIIMKIIMTQFPSDNKCIFIFYYTSLRFNPCLCKLHKLYNGKVESLLIY